MNLTDIIYSKKANSLTKYPSIVTYHALDKGLLTETLNVLELNTAMEKFITEKIDGANTRILILNQDYLLGSREDFFYAKQDRVIPTKERAKVEFLKGIANAIIDSGLIEPNKLYCIYGELHGSKIQKAWQHYTLSENQYGYRVFDAWKMPIDDFETIHKFFDENQASNWRESGKQSWFDVPSLQALTNAVYGLTMVPYLEERTYTKPGETLEETYEWLQQFKDTRVNLDGKEKKNSKAEGVVIRDETRQFIAKLRFEDYEKTFKKRK